MNPEHDADTRRLGRTMGFLATVAFLALGWVSFHGVIERRDDPNRNLVVEPGASELVLRRDRAGHYRFPGLINGRPVRFLLDTGATHVAVPAHLAEALQLAPGARSTAVTANGPVSVRETAIGELAFGPFRLTGVRGHLNPGMKEDEVLLGMSVLKHLDFAQRGDVLVLRPVQPAASTRDERT
ncbi:MAG: TIGR02281 family clan AA aspartic protease [Gammaproteobacteria bacterium]|nr:MAG: TIGR02281 family clan AA aspartic protease [Gammaproteobacteria bacterium]